MFANSKLCTVCLVTLPASEFHTRKQKGKTYLYHCCKACRNKSKKQKLATGQLLQKTYPEAVQRRVQRNKQRRAEGLDRAKYILEDTRRSDKRKGRSNDLTRDFVEEIIKGGCAYCGSTDMMTLDRVCNALGHTQANVRPACYRCNLLKSDMPEEAWAQLIPAVRSIFERGLFGDWRKNKNNKHV